MRLSIGEMCVLYWSSLSVPIFLHAVYFAVIGFVCKGSGIVFDFFVRLGCVWGLLIIGWSGEYIDNRWLSGETLRMPISICTNTYFLLLWNVTMTRKDAFWFRTYKLNAWKWLILMISLIYILKIKLVNCLVYLTRSHLMNHVTCHSIGFILCIWRIL